VTRRLAVLLSVAVAACSDGVGPAGSQGPALLLSVQAPLAVSSAELGALGTAFDLVDSYRITVQDSASSVVLLADTISVASGLTEHRFDLGLDPDLVGVPVLVSIIGFDGSTELYRSSAYTTIQAAAAVVEPVVLSVRYTGPGVRGTVTDDSGIGQGGLAVALYSGNTLTGSTSTEADGTYLFLNIAPGAYSVEPVPPASLYVCPGNRNVSVQSGDALVADFTTTATPCQIDLLILSGGDFDDTGTVAALLADSPGVNTSTFFYVNQTPGLATLRRYDVVLLFVNGIFNETQALGNELAQYVQAGGNLVIGSFYWQARSDGGFSSPGWGDLESLDPFTAKVNPFTGKGGATYSADYLNANTIVAHPLTIGVNTIASVAGYSAGVAAKPTTAVVASWGLGDPFIGYRILGGGQRIVAVSLFPAATVNQVSGDVQPLWENAVTWAGIAGGPTP
jgi:hypothetical protein